MRKIFILLAMLAASEINSRRYHLVAAELPAYRTQIWPIPHLNVIARTKLAELTREKSVMRTRGDVSPYTLAALSCEKEKVSNLLRYVGLCDPLNRRRLRAHEVEEKNRLRMDLEAHYILGPESFGVGRENVKIGQEGLLLLGAIKTEEIERGVVFHRDN